jgi:hypothetical protein
MRPKIHILSGLLFSIVFYLFVNISLFELTILFLSTWLFIDLDHVLIYFIQTGNLNSRKFFKTHKRSKESWNKIPLNQKSKYKKPYFIFHGIEFITIILLLAQIWEIFYFVLIGTLFHLILDYIDILIKKENIIFKTTFVGTFIHNRNKIKRKTIF